MRKVALGFALCATALGPARAGAHDLWLERTARGFLLRAGHAGHEAIPLDVSAVSEVRCARAGEPVHPLTPRPDRRGAVRVEGSCDAVSAFVDQGFFVLTPNGEKHLRKGEAPDAVRSWRSRQYAKWIDARVPGAAAPLGDALEIVPVTDLARARAGERVTVRVLLEGRVARGAIVSMGHERLAETSSAGEARVKVRHAGLASISATLQRPLGTPDADTEVLEASLSFEVPR
jgi:nickel transport protein